MKRKKILAFGGTQFWTVALVGGTLTVLLAFAGLHGIYTAKQVLSPAVFAGVKADFVASTVRLFVVGGLFVLVATVASAFLSHRMVGPAHRLANEIRRHIDSGNAEKPIRVREGDELEDLVDAVNRLLFKAQTQRLKEETFQTSEKQ